MIRLHHCHETRSMRSLWLLNELGIEFEVAVYPFDKTLRSDAYPDVASCRPGAGAGTRWRGDLGNRRDHRKCFASGFPNAGWGARPTIWIAPTG